MKGTKRAKPNERKFWRKATGEAVGFSVLMPVVVIIIAIVVTLLKLSLFRQKMEYAAYAACRAAVVSKDLKEANKYAKEVVKLELAPYAGLIDQSTLYVRVSTTSDYVTPAISAGDDSRSKSQTRKNKSSKWIKGSFVKCEIKVNLIKSGIILDGQEKKTEIYMAVEKENY